MKRFLPFIITLVLVLGFLILVSYPYFFSKINRFDSLGLLSVVEEKKEDVEKTGNAGRSLLKGEKLSGKLKAAEDNFGILLFKFAKLSGKASDTVVFRIKEEGQDKWHYENQYKSDQFQIDQYFTFGFPPFENSKNKTYVFEIESLFGSIENSIGLSEDLPRIALVYKFSKKDLGNSEKLLSFTAKKFTYTANNIDPWQNIEFLILSLLIYIFIYLIRKEKIAFTKLKKSRFGFLRWFLNRRLNTIEIFSNKIKRRFIATKFYLVLFNTHTKKRLVIGLLIFLIVLLYRFSLASPDYLGVSSFYAGLGGQGDYDQFIRAATCAIRSFCPAILGQNFLIESSVLGIFYEIFGFVGGLKAYLYLMIILSSIVATLPYLLLSRNTWFTIGGIAGALFLATSDFLTDMALRLPPDNGSLFLFSMFYIVYLLALQLGTIRWLLFFGLMGTIDGLNKLILLMNDLVILILFIPVFYFEKAKKLNKTPFIKLDPKLILYSLLPFLVFLLIYSSWEYIVQVKFSSTYYLRALFEGGPTYGSSTIEASNSIKHIVSKSNILEIIYYYAGSTIVMLKRLILNSALTTPLLAPIFIGLLFFTFRKPPAKDGLAFGQRFFIAKFISIVIFASLVIMTLVLFKSNFLKIQDIGQYVYAWSNDIYINVFLFASIIFLFILNFRYLAFKLALPILPYVAMIIILTKNAPWERMLSHILVWSIILFSFLIDWILSNVKKDYALKRLWIGPILLVLFIFFYMIPKTSSMIVKLWEGYFNVRAEVKYLKWVKGELPENAIILLGGKSDLITVAQNLDKPIVYNSTWGSALLIKPKEIPGVKPSDFAVLMQLKISEIPGVTPSDFSIIQELQNKDNFKKNKYLILENDIYLWRDRIAGIADNVFAKTSATQLNPDNYSIKVYKFNPSLNKGLYELRIKEMEDF